MWKFSATIAALVLSACGSSENDFVTAVAPSSWSDDQRAIAFSMPTPRLCWHYRNGRSLPNIDNRVQPAPYSTADYSVLNTVLRQRGLSRRDLEILRDPSIDFGTGQSPAGLNCSLPNVEVVNKSFIAGRHSWQIRTPGGQFIYFEGDGTLEGMRVTGWN